MKLSISNIAWDGGDDAQMYAYLKEAGFQGVEIAPTRIIPENPYEKCALMESVQGDLEGKYGLCIPSLQSIWFGRAERIFGSAEERGFLFAYTKKIIDFAKAAKANNIVFGCPKNRCLDSPEQMDIAYDFFDGLATYAAGQGVVIGLEANPPIYHTNFINTSEQAFSFVKALHNNGLNVTLDLGTVIQNKESIYSMGKDIGLVSHIHISEPNLEYICERKLHRELACVLKESGYDKFVSIEMKKCGDLSSVRRVCEYIKGLFEYLA